MTKCTTCHGLGYYDEGHENDDGSMSGGNYVECGCVKNEQHQEIMTNLIRLPPTTTMTSEQALQSALVDAENNHLKDVLIIGYDEDGDLFIRSSRLTCAEALFLANKAMRWAESGGEL